MSEPQPRAPAVDLLRLCRATSPGLTTAVLVVTGLSGLLPTAFSLASGATVGTLPNAVGAGLDSQAGSRLTWFLTLAVVLFVLMQALGPVRETVADALMVRVDTNLARRIMALTSGPSGIAHLEDPGTVNRLRQAQGVISGNTPGGAIYAFSIVWYRRLTGVAAVLVVVSFRWWLAVALVATQLVVFWWRRRLWEVQTSVIYKRSSALRRSSYLRGVAVDAAAAKEVRVFGLDRWLVARYGREFEESMAPVWDARRRGGPVALGVAALVAVVQGAALLVMTRAALDGALGVGAVVVYAQAIIATSGLGAFAEEHGRTTDGLVSLRVLRELERDLPGPAVGTPGLPVDGLPRRSIRFESVGFRYPGRSDHVFTNLDLELEVGRSVAIVGGERRGQDHAGEAPLRPVRPRRRADHRRRRGPAPARPPGLATASGRHLPGLRPVPILGVRQRGRRRPGPGG